MSLLSGDERKMIEAVVRVFKEPSDLAGMTASRMSLSDHEIMPFAMMKYDECRAAFHKKWVCFFELN